MDRFQKLAAMTIVFLTFTLEFNCTPRHPESLSSDPEGRGQAQCRVRRKACFSSCLALGPHQQRLFSKASEAGPSADTVLTMTHYLPAAAPVRAAVPLKNRSAARAKVNLAVRLRW